MEGMRLEAAGNYEAAARLYVEALRSAGPTMTPEGVSFLSNRAAAAYVAIADWTGLEDVSSITGGNIYCGPSVLKSGKLQWNLMFDVVSCVG